MTELNSFQPHASLPPWAMPNAVDLTRWQWQAPTPPSKRMMRATLDIPEAPSAKPDQTTRGEEAKPGAVLDDHIPLLSTGAAPPVQDVATDETLAAEEVKQSVHLQHVPSSPPPPPPAPDLPMDQVAAAERVEPCSTFKDGFSPVAIPEAGTSLDMNAALEKAKPDLSLGASPLTQRPSSLRSGTSSQLGLPLSMLVPRLEELAPTVQPLGQIANDQFKTLSLHQRLVLLETKDIRTAKIFDSRFQDFLRYFEEQLVSGRLSKDEIQIHFFHGLMRARNGSDKFSSLRNPGLSLMYVTMRGIEASKQVNPSSVPKLARFWQAMLSRLSDEVPSLVSGEVFTLIMKNMALRTLFRTRYALSRVLNGYFDLWRDFNVHGNPENWDHAQISKAINMAYMWIGRLEREKAQIQLHLDKKKVGKARSAVRLVKRHEKRAERFMHKAASLMSDDERHIKVVAEALAEISPLHHRPLVAEYTALAVEGTYGGWTRSRHNWLKVLARMRRVDSATFMDFLRLFPKRSHMALSDTELCDLLLLQWQSRGRLCRPVVTRDLYKTIMGGDDHLAFGALAQAISKTEDHESCTSLFWSYWTYLRAVNRGKRFLVALKLLRKTQSISPHFLQRVAWTAHDHRVAVDLYDFCLTITKRTGLIWPPQFWDKFAGMMTKRWKYPRFNPVRLTDRLIGVYPGSRDQPAKLARYHTNGDTSLEGAGGAIPDGDGGNYAYELAGNVYEEFKPGAANGGAAPDWDAGVGASVMAKEDQEKRRIGRLKWSADILRKAPQLNDREAFRHVSKVIALMEKEKEEDGLSAIDLAPLAKVVTRELDRGEVGRTERLKWFLKLIIKHLGEEAAIQVGTILKSQRDANFRQWQEELGVGKDPFQAVLEQKIVQSHSRDATF